MKTRLAALLCLALPLALFADEAPLVDSSAIAPEGPRYTAEQLDQLVGPIALYPDALIALILPASTLPGDVTLAARYIKNDGDPADAAGRSWDESVKSLVRYGEVVSWMDENLEWTKQLGEAFRLQPAEVMDAIQRMRAKARASGALVDTPQQQVIVDSNVISLVPTQPDVIYVPYYDPAVVYGPPGYYGAPAGYYGSSPFVTFSAGFVAGAWLAFDCDWHRRTVWTADRHWAARRDHDWRHPVFPGQAGYVADPGRHQWRPSSFPSHTARYVAPIVARPTPISQFQRPPVNHDYSSNRHNVPPDRYAHDDRSSGANPPPAVGGGSNPPPSTLRASRTGVPISTTPAPRPRIDPTYTGVVSGPPTPASATAPAPAPTPATTGASERRIENGRNRYGDRSDRSSSAPAPSPTPGQSTSAPAPARIHPNYNSGAVSGPPAPASAAPVPASVRTYVPPAATRSAPAPAPAPAAPAPTYSRGGATPAPAAPATQPATTPARSSSDDHGRGSRSDNEQKKQN